MRAVLFGHFRAYLLKRFGETLLRSLDKFTLQMIAVPKSGKKPSGVQLTPEQIPRILFRLIVRMFLVLGLRPGEMFALRWNDKQQNSLRIDSSITNGIEVETKTEGSDASVRLPASIDTELEWWRTATADPSPDAFIFPSARGTPINTNNYMAQLTTVKDVQAHLRHSTAKTTLEHYIKSVPASVRVAVESVDQLLKSIPAGPDEPAN